MTIKFGPAGIGPVKEVEETFARFKKQGIKVAEIPFTYGVFIKEREIAEKVKKAAENTKLTFAFFNNHWQGYAPGNAVDLKKQMRLPFQMPPFQAKMPEDEK